MQTMLDTTNWASYPFTVNGINFVSLLDPQGIFYSKVERLPEGVFTNENVRMVGELIGDPSAFTTAELQAELDRINDGASQALVALA
jgi:hypothetical protein